mmetsp:Transcript_20472/g.31260  ORF Transcript_20472/g.31260 Transcript_20472/m.31260 type:complete len:302 (-) Transcript_20472:3790-4695(-)
MHRNVHSLLMISQCLRSITGVINLHWNYCVSLLNLTVSAFLTKTSVVTLKLVKISCTSQLWVIPVVAVMIFQIVSSVNFIVLILFHRLSLQLMIFMVKCFRVDFLEVKWMLVYYQLPVCLLRRPSVSGVQCNRRCYLHQQSFITFLICVIFQESFKVFLVHLKKHFLPVVLVVLTELLILNLEHFCLVFGSMRLCVYSVTSLQMRKIRYFAQTLSMMKLSKLLIPYLLRKCLKKLIWLISYAKIFMMKTVSFRKKHLKNMNQEVALLKSKVVFLSFSISIMKIIQVAKWNLSSLMMLFDIC